MTIIAELLGESTGIKVRSPFAVFVDQAAIGEFGSAEGMPPQAAHEPMTIMAPALKVSW